MTSTINDVFLGSAVLVEYERADRTELLNLLCERSEYNPFINETVLSEYAFQMLALYGRKAPLTLKVNGLISATLIQADIEPVLIQFTFLANSPAVVLIYLHLIAKYNLLPNDALILATRKLYNVSRLASYDSDFATACAGEGIQLIQSVADLNV